MSNLINSVSNKTHYFCVLAKKREMQGIFIAFKIGFCISQMTVFKAKITTQMAFSSSTK
jgi:hypothetical protein